MSSQDPVKKHERLRFAYDYIEPVKATEPPLPFYEAAKNHVPNPYVNSRLTHPKIQEIRARSTMSPELNAQIDYAQNPETYPAGFPYYVRGRDSLREYISTLFTTQIAIYDGAMGTMIQNYAKKNKLEEEEYRGERFKDWSCNTKGNNGRF